MMRPVLACVTLLGVCGALVGAASGAGAHGAPPGASRGVYAAAAARPPRSWPFTLSPAPEDLSLAEVGFPHAARGQRLSRASLQLRTAGPFGDDYLVLAVAHVGAGRPPRALVLLSTGHRRCSTPFRCGCG